MNARLALVAPTVVYMQELFSEGIKTVFTSSAKVVVDSSMDQQIPW